jgi:hypothetical protein
MKHSLPEADDFSERKANSVVPYFDFAVLCVFTPLREQLVLKMASSRQDAKSQRKTAN